jgi:hypothetical protein
MTDKPLTAKRTRSEIARQAALARWDRNREEDGRDLIGYVEIVPGVWQPAGMAAAERWKAQMRRRQQGT